MRLTTAGLLAGLSFACLEAQPITGVKVWDADFNAVKQLTPAELPEFERAWSAKTVVDGSLNSIGGQHFKLDIDEGSEAGDRWLYQTTGYIQVLAVKANRPVYRLQNPELFNKLIGATK